MSPIEKLKQLNRIYTQKQLSSMLPFSQSSISYLVTEKRKSVSYDGGQAIDHLYESKIFEINQISEV